MIRSHHVRVRTCLNQAMPNHPPPLSRGQIKSQQGPNVDNEKIELTEEPRLTKTEE